MKRGELVAGQSYYHGTGLNWHDRVSRGCRAELVDAGWWRSPSPGHRSREPIQCEPGRQGAGVLVDLHYSRPDGTTRVERARVVRLADLHGPYDKTLAEVERRQAERVAEQQQRQAQLDELRAGADQVVSALADLGVESGRYGREPGWVDVRAADLMPILRLVAAAWAWHLDPTDGNGFELAGAVEVVTNRKVETP